MLYPLPNPNIKITFRQHLFGIHIAHFYKSLQQYLPHYGQQLERIFPKKWPRHVEYLCPLCVKNLFVTSRIGDFSSSSFNVDHYPPKSVGGRGKMIVCEPCNNRAGTKFESELQPFLNQQSFKSGNSNSILKAKLDFNGQKKTQVFLTKSHTGEMIFEPGTHNTQNPDFQEWINNWGAKDRRPFTLEITNANQKKVCKSLIKTAYLDCFGLWGYDFVFSDTGEYLRKVLNDELEYPFPEGHAFILEKDLSKYFMGVNLLENEGLRIIAVLIPLIYKKDHYNSIAGILIPNFPGELENLFKTPAKEMTFNVKKIPHFEIDQQLKAYSEFREQLSKPIVGQNESKNPSE
jgi:hypothetical protein